MLIYIPLCFYFIKHAKAILPDVILNLHSTMLLLYPMGSAMGIDSGLNLHSTMLLLYLAVSPVPSVLRSWFTFHYASTLSFLDSAPLDISLNLHSTMLLLYPVPLFPFYFLQYGDTFCLPPFCIALLSKIFLLPLYKIWIFLDISSFVYPTVFFLYLRSTIIKSCLFYHHPLPKIP